MRKKRGQIIGQVFMLILAALVFVLILVYGYRAINSILKTKDEVAFVDFTTTLKAEVKQLTLSYGSVKKTALQGLPSKFKEVCFVTGKDKGVNDDEDLDGLQTDHPRIYELYEPNGEANVFFEPSAPKNILLDGIQALGSYDGATVSWFCVPVDQGSVYLTFEGLGNGVRVTEWPQ